MRQDTTAFLGKCLHFTVAWERNLARNASLEVIHPKIRFHQVFLDIQMTILRTASGNIKVLTIMDGCLHKIFKG